MKGQDEHFTNDSQELDTVLTNTEIEIDQKRKFKPPDGGWGWVIVGAAFMVHVIADGVLYTLGILYVEFLDEFKEGKGTTAWVSSLCITFMLVPGPVVSIITNRFGCRIVCIAGSLIAACGLLCASFATNIYLLYAFMGVISGTGFGCILLSTIVCIGYYFEKKRSLAMGLSVGGAGVGTFVFAPLVNKLIDIYGWRGAVLIESALLLNIIVCGAFFRPLNFSHTSKNIKTVAASSTELNKDEIKPLTKDSHNKNKELCYDDENINHPTDCEKDKLPASLCDFIFTIFDFSLLINPVFVIFVISNSSVAIVYNAPFTYLPDRAEEKGISKVESAFLLSVLGIANTIGRFFFGWLGDRKCVSRLALFGSALCMCGIANLLNPLNDSYPFLIAYSIVHGLFIGVFISLNSVIMADLFGLEKLSNTLGLIMLFQGIFVLVGLPMAGWLYDATGDYKVPFYVVGAMFIFSGVILSLIPVIQARRKEVPARKRTR